MDEVAGLKSSMKRKPSNSPNHHEINKEKDKENKLDTNNWDCIDTAKKAYLITRDRLDCEKIVYLSKSNNKEKVDEHGSEQINVISESDLYLSEVESDSEDLDRAPKTAHEPIVLAPLTPIEQNIYFYQSLPSSIEKIFNYYENLSLDILKYIETSPCLVMPQSLISFNANNRSDINRRTWLCSIINLDNTRFKRFS